MDRVQRRAAWLAVWGWLTVVSPVPQLAGEGGRPDRSAPETLRSFLREFVLSEFVAITPGEGKFPKAFRRGTSDGPAEERPAQEVAIARRFSIAKGEVSQNLYAAVMGADPSKWKGPRNSAEMMTFGEAQEFCRRLTALLRDVELIGADDEIRLPTEAEWEYCCRAGTTTAYSFGESATRPGDQGNQAGVLDAFGWHTGNAAGNDPPVGAKKPNPWGLYDMHGYLWEFVADDWHDDYSGAPTDGSARSGSAAPRKHVVRGGSWKDRHEHLRSASRRAVAADARDDAIGLRCVLAKTRAITTDR